MWAITDNSTYEPGKGALPTTGMPYVLVNGVVVVKDSVVKKVFPGKPIRFPVMEKGRLDQISIEPRTFDPNQWEYEDEWGGAMVNGSPHCFRH